MKNEYEAIGNLLFELEEAEKTAINSADEGTYSIAYDYGAAFTLQCCYP